MVDGFCRELQASVCRPRQWRLIVWQRVKNGWRNSTGMGIRRQTSQWKFFARITAVPINCPSPAAGSTGIGATTGPAAWSRPRWSGGGCRVPARCEPQCEPWRTRPGAPFPFRWNRNGALDFDLRVFLTRTGRTRIKSGAGFAEKRPRIVPECDGTARDLYVRNGDGTNRARITDLAPYSVVHG